MQFSIRFWHCCFLLFFSLLNLRCKINLFFNFIFFRLATFIYRQPIAVKFLTISTEIQFILNSQVNFIGRFLAKKINVPFSRFYILVCCCFRYSTDSFGSCERSCLINCNLSYDFRVWYFILRQIYDAHDTISDIQLMTFDRFQSIDTGNRTVGDTAIFRPPSKQSVVIFANSHTNKNKLISQTFII